MFDHPETKNIFENIKPNIIESVKEQIEKHGVLNTAKIRGYQTEDYDNLIVAGRLLHFDVRQHVAPTFLEFFDNIKDRIQDIYYNFAKTHNGKIQEDIDKSIAVVYRRIDFFSYSCYKNNYLAKMSYDNEVAETPEYLCMRIAIQLHFEDGINKVLECFHEILDGDVMLASPINFNSCMKNNNLISCFLGQLKDDLEALLTTGCVEFAMISKGTGALGIDISEIRHSDINGGGESEGLLPWMQIFNATARGANQESRRKGSMAVSLRAFHYDVEDFINSIRKVGDRYKTNHDLNITIYANQIFFDRVKSRGKWTLFCPAKTKWLNGIYGDELTKKYIETEKLAEEREQEYLKLQKLYDEQRNISNYNELYPLKIKLIEAKKNRIKYKVISAEYLFDEIAKMQKQTGMPYLNNCDAINDKCNLKNVGYVGSQNLCQEITIPADSENYGSCNLGSISLSSFAIKEIDRSIKDLKKALVLCYDFSRLGYRTKNMVSNLYNVIIHSKYPLDKVIDGKLVRGKISKPNFKNCPIGIGVQGFAEALYELDLRIEDDKNYVELFNLMIFACMYWNAMAESIILSIQKGPYENFKGSPLSEGKFQKDLWADEFKRLGPNKSRPNEPETINPSDWGQKAIPLPNGDIILPTWDDLSRCVVKWGAKTSLNIALMPTATSSQSLRNTETVEAPNAMLYSRTLGTGNYPVLIRHFVNDFTTINLWNDVTFNYLQFNDGLIKGFDTFLESNLDKFQAFDMKNFGRVKFLIQKYKSMWDISQKYMLKLMADRCRYVCQSASLNIYLENPTIETLKACHLTANALGLKTLMYYLRQKTSNTAMKFTIDPELYKLMSKSLKDSKKLEVVKEDSEKSKAKDDKLEVLSEELQVCDPNNKDCLACQ